MEDWEAKAKLLLTKLGIPEHEVVPVWRDPQWVRAQEEELIRMTPTWQADEDDGAHMAR